VPALRIRLERLGFRAAHAGLRVWWFVRRPHHHGVKCVLRAPGADGRADVLFVRHAYGDRAEWQLPGGGIGRREDPHTAALREAHEELGVDVSRMRSLGVVEDYSHYKSVTLHCFEANVDPGALSVRWGEIEEVRWAPADRPPRPYGLGVPAILRLVRERA
jgi:8-oxo-dGTP pyrophosphatase MutT (NUDIX family)